MLLEVVVFICLFFNVDLFFVIGIGVIFFFGIGAGGVGVIM